MEITKFFCSRTARGVTACTVQCDECKNRPADATPIEGCIGSGTAPQPALEEQPKPKAEVVQLDDARAPAVELAAQIIITLDTAGNMRVDGPFEDRLLFHGMLAMAADVERDMLLARRHKDAQLAAQRAKEPWFKRRLRERREAKAAEAKARAEAEARRAAEASKDELQKALAK